MTSASKTSRLGETRVSGRVVAIELAPGPARERPGREDQDRGGRQGDADGAHGRQPVRPRRNDDRREEQAGQRRRDGHQQPFDELRTEQLATGRATPASEHDLRTPAPDDEDRDEGDRPGRDGQRSERRDRERRLRGRPFGEVAVDGGAQPGAQVRQRVGDATRRVEFGLEPAEVGDERIELSGVDLRAVHVEAPAVGRRQPEGDDVLVGLRGDQPGGVGDRVVHAAPDRRADETRVGEPVVGIGLRHREQADDRDVGRAGRPREDVAHDRIAGIDRHVDRVADADLRLGRRLLGQRDLDGRRHPLARRLREPRGRPARRVRDPVVEAVLVLERHVGRVVRRIRDPKPWAADHVAAVPDDSLDGARDPVPELLGRRLYPGERRAPRGDLVHARELDVALDGGRPGQSVAQAVVRDAVEQSRADGHEEAGRRHEDEQERDDAALGSQPAEDGDDGRGQAHHQSSPIRRTEASPIRRRSSVITAMVIASTTVLTATSSRDGRPRDDDLDRRDRRDRLLGDGHEGQDDPGEEQPERRPGDEADRRQPGTLERQPGRQLPARQADRPEQRELGDPLARRDGGVHHEPDDREDGRRDEPDGERSDDPERDRIGRQGARAFRLGEDRDARQRGGAQGLGDGREPRVVDREPPLVRWP